MEATLATKRPREESQALQDCEESSKRHKPYTHILSLLESAEELEDSTQDLSPLITILQQEITCRASDSLETTLLMSPTQNNNDQNTLTTTPTTIHLEDCSSSTNNGTMVREDENERVMRLLLEASDDELGIPNTREDELVLEFGEEDGLLKNGDMFSSICDGLWELEDEAANYYALLQAELFL